MTGPGCRKKGKRRKHTPYMSESQATAGNIALAVKKGKLPKSKLKGASKSMHKGMTLQELESHSAEAKGKKLPKKKGVGAGFSKYIKGRKSKAGKKKR